MKRNKKLSDAVRIAANAEIEELKKQREENGEHIFSSEFNSKMSSAFEKKKEPPVKHQYLKRAAVAFCCLLIAFSFSYYVKRFLGPNKSIWLASEQVDNENNCVYEPAYVPAGYELFGRKETDELIRIEYRNGKGESIVFEQSKNPYDIYYTGYEKSVILINNRPVLCCRNNDMIILNFDVGYCFFTITGTADYEEMIKMCELKEAEIKN